MGNPNMTVNINQDHQSNIISIQQYYQQHQYQVISLSHKEVDNFLFTALSPATGLTAISIDAVAGLLDTADAVAALTLEAVQAYSEPFEPAHIDVSRAHKGNMTSANNIRALMEGSRNINESKRATQDAVALSAIPQYHGPARDLYDASFRACVTELNSVTPSFGTTPKDAPLFHAQPLITHSLSLSHALFIIAEGSVDRCAEMVNYVKTAPESVQQGFHAALPLASLQAEINALRQQLLAAQSQPLSANSAFSVALTLSTLVASTHTLLAQETVAALQLLALRDQILFQAHAEKEAKKAAAAAAAPDAAKANPKRQEKQGAKKAPKGVLLGNGVRPLRKYLLSALVSASSSSSSSSSSASAASSNDADAAAEDSVINMTLIDSEASLQQAISSIRAALDIQNGNASAWRSMLEPLLLALNVNKRPKIAKGTRDTTPEQMAIREKAFAAILDVFRRHGAVGIDTPVFELRETLMGKYGEDSKLIYDLADQGGELLSLRYDLTVPFARYLAMAPDTQLKRYHIAKVYRRDNPAMNRGRFREFYQCDYDVSGSYGSMIPDSDVIKVLTEVLTDLRIGKFVVKLNHRKLLDAMMAICGVPKEKFRPICSAIDKLDKETWETVQDEMVSQKGLDISIAQRIGNYVRADCELVQLKAHPLQVLEKLQADALLAAHPQAQAAFTELGLLFRYLTALGALPFIHFDLSLARGLDYYTGVIYEAVLCETDRVGSIAAGGRYDGLVGRFSGSDVPAVGVSIGIERILTILEEQERARAGGKIRATATEVLVASVGSNLLETRMQICSELWAAGIKAEFVYAENPKLPKQLSYADETQIPFAVIFGSDELDKGLVKVKNLALKAEVEVSRSDMCRYIKQALLEAASSPVSAVPAVDSASSSS